jgi:hypothetical protein
MIVPSFRLTESELSGGLSRLVFGLDSIVCEATITTIRLRMAHPEPSLDEPRRGSLTASKNLTPLLIHSSTNITAMLPITS